MSDKRVLVTGATGMIGRALVEALRYDGLDIVAVGRKSSASVEVDYSWQLGASLGTALDGVDVVIHLAARVHIRGTGYSDKAGFFHDNAECSLRLAKEAHDRGVKRFIFISSIGVLGSESSVPLRESDPCRPHSAYTSSKYISEQLLRDFAASSGMELVILRPPAVIGSGVKGNVRSLLSVVGWQLPIPFSMLANQRQFVTLQGLASAISIAVSHEGAPGQIFHVANPERISTRNMCNMIASCFGVKPRLWPVPPSVLRAVFIGVGRRSLADGLTGDLLIDTDKITRVLGWAPHQSICSALRKIVSVQGRSRLT